VTVTGIIPVAEVSIGTICTASCFHISRISFASSWYLFCFSVVVLYLFCFSVVVVVVVKSKLPRRRNERVSYFNCTSV
jgi:hypothetical protein